MSDRFEEAVKFSLNYSNDNRTSAGPEEYAALKKILSHPQDHPCPFCGGISCSHWDGTGWVNPRFKSCP